MTSFGLGEIGIILVMALIFFDVKQIGKAMKLFGKLRSKFNRMQRDFRYQFDNLISAEEEKEELEKVQNSVHEARMWGSKRAQNIPGWQKSKAAETLVTIVESFSPYLEAKTVAAYSALHDELDSLPLLKKIIADGKILLLPYLKEMQIHMAPVNDLEKDTSIGAFGILEPIEKCRDQTPPSPSVPQEKP